MNEHKLSNRLMAVARYVNHLKSFADIGSDHAYLPSYLCLTNPSICAVAGEIVEVRFKRLENK